MPQFYEVFIAVSYKRNDFKTGSNFEFTDQSKRQHFRRVTWCTGAEFGRNTDYHQALHTIV